MLWVQFWISFSIFPSSPCSLADRAREIRWIFCNGNKVIVRKICYIFTNFYVAASGRKRDKNRQRFFYFLFLHFIESILNVIDEGKQCASSTHKIGIFIFDAFEWKKIEWKLLGFVVPYKNCWMAIGLGSNLVQHCFAFFVAYKCIYTFAESENPKDRIEFWR